MAAQQPKDDFEAFRQKKLQQKAQAEEARSEEARTDEAAKKMGWIDGLGPAGPKNPKVKGFVLGRFWPKKVDPSTLQKPKGFEATSQPGAKGPGAERPPTPKEELDKRPRPKGIQRY